MRYWLPEIVIIWSHWE